MMSRPRGAGRGAPDADLDRVIDAVARQMTETAPAGGADFRHRVLARIEAVDAPRNSWRAAWVLSPIAVAAAIAMAVFVARGVQYRDRGPVLRQAQSTPSSPRDEQTTRQESPIAAGDPNGPVRQLEPLSRRRSAGRQPGERRSTGASRDTNAQNAVEALAAPSLGLVPLTVDAITPDRIQIDRLDVIAPINVAPLDITDAQRRDE